MDIVGRVDETTSSLVEDFTAASVNYELSLHSKTLGGAQLMHSPSAATNPIDVVESERELETIRHVLSRIIESVISTTSNIEVDLNAESSIVLTDDQPVQGFTKNKFGSTKLCVILDQAHVNFECGELTHSIQHTIDKLTVIGPSKLPSTDVTQSQEDSIMQRFGKVNISEMNLFESITSQYERHMNRIRGR